MSIDKRTDAGQFYPGGKVVSTRPVATGGDVRHAEFADVTVETNTMPALRAAVRSLAAKLGATVVSALAVSAAIGASVQTVPINDLDFDANPNVVTNVTLEGLATTGEVARVVADAEQNLTGATNAVLDAAKDYTDSAMAGATPGDYANVSNRSVNALSRAEAEAGFTEWVYSDESTGVEVIGQPTFVSDSGPDTYWFFQLLLNGAPASLYIYDNAYATTLRAVNEGDDGNISFTANRIRLPTMADVQLTPIYGGNGHEYEGWVIEPQEYEGETVSLFFEYGAPPCFTWGEFGAEVATNVTTDVIQSEHFTATLVANPVIGYTLGSQTDKPIASTNDLARASAIPPVVTNIVRDLSLGGIWDSQLEIWWTPRMANGSLTYEATTNVNLNEEN